MDIGELKLTIPIIFGHRGASNCEPENTLLAFERAFSDGAQGIEFDVRSTKDNKIVIIHDETINRTSNGTGKVKDFTLNELLIFNFGKNEKIPTLKEVLSKYGNKYWLNIEIKEEGLEQQIVKLIKDHKISQKIVISSFLIPVLNKIKEFDKEIPTAFLYDFPMDDLDELIKEIDINGLHPGKNQVSEELITNAHSKSLVVRSWTIDEISIAKEFSKIGIDGIITNNPKVIISAITTKK